jgi:L-amino acid N-acyltransferase YncA
VPVEITDVRLGARFHCLLNTLVMNIRPADQRDFEGMWPIFSEIVATGTTYAFSPETRRDEAFAYWFGAGVRSYVAEDREGIVGMYRLVANQPGLGSHVANASFMVSPAHEGKGVGSAMGLHCLREAKRAGFKAMQFNLVISTNEAAVSLWKKLGFSIVGTLPKAFRHQQLGYVNAYIMYRFLDDINN